MNGLTARKIGFDEIEPMLRREMRDKSWSRKFIMLIRWSIWQWQKIYQEGTYKVFVLTKRDSKNTIKSIKTADERQEVFLEVSLTAWSDRRSIITARVLLDEKRRVLSPSRYRLMGIYKETREHIFLFLKY